MPVELTCQHCEKVFRVKPRDAGQKYCSVACMRGFESEAGRIAAQVPPSHFACKQCGKDFTMKQSYLTAYRKKWDRDPIYCSMRCMGDSKKLTDADWQVSCIQCGNPMPIQRRPGGAINRQKRICSPECRSLFRRLSYQAKFPDGNSIHRVGRNGYIRYVIPGKNGEAARETFLHRYVMEQHIGRRLLSEETVHHINGTRGDNRLENLELFSSRHGPGQRVVDKVEFALEMLRLYPEFIIAAGGTVLEHAPFSIRP